MQGAVGSEDWNWTEEGEGVKFLLKLINTSAGPLLWHFVHIPWLLWSPLIDTTCLLTGTKFWWGLKRQRPPVADPDNRRKTLNLLPCGSTDKVQLLSYKGLRRQLPSTMVQHLPFKDHIPTVLWLLKVCLNFCKGSLPLNSNPPLSSFCISFWWWILSWGFHSAEAPKNNFYVVPCWCRAVCSVLSSLQHTEQY